MAEPSPPIKDPTGSSADTLAQHPDSSSSINPTLKSETPSAPPVSPPVRVVTRPPEPETISIPSYSRWFSWNNVHECEARFLPEFFDSRSPSKNPRVYKYYRNSIIQCFRQSPSRKLTFTDVRKTLVGDVGSIRRVFDFLEAWGLINYAGSALKQPSKWEEKDNKAGGASSHSGDRGVAVESIPKRRWCGGCKSLCSIACFACDKFDLTLCARCYVRGNYRVGVNSSDFRRVEISEDTKAGWTEKETLHLLEAVLHRGDDWKKVSEHVGSKNEKECVAHFVKLSFGEQFHGHTSSGDIDSKFSQVKDQNEAERGLDNIGFSSQSKKMRLTPLSDASNPIMAQAAFLSALVGVEVAEAAAEAAVASLSDLEPRKKEGVGSSANGAIMQEPNVASNGDATSNTWERAYADAKTLLEKEELDAERAVSNITEVQMKEIWNRIDQFEESELHMEKEWHHLQQMKNLLFVDQLTLLFHKAAAPKIVESMGDGNLKAD